MSEDLLFLAERACFEAFVTCYTQELGAGEWHRAATWRAEDRDFCPQGELVLVLVLPREGLRLAIDVIYHSAVGRHRLGAVRCERSGRWYDGDRLHTVLTLVRTFQCPTAPDLLR